VDFLFIFARAIHALRTDAAKPMASRPKREKKKEKLAPMAADCPVAVRDLPGRGAGLVATRPIAPGEVIVREAPLLLLPEAAAAGAVCAACLCYLSSAAQPHPCPGCRRVAFCGPACAAGAAAAPAHHTPLHCAALAASDERGLSPDAATSLRFALAAASLQAAAAADNNPSARAAWAAFESLAAPPGLPSVAETVGVVGPRLGAALAAARPGWGVAADTLAGWLAREAANAFGVLAPLSSSPDADPSSRAVRGSGLYPLASRFNHDCLPCAARFDFFDDPRAVTAGAQTSPALRTLLEVRALHAIPAGEEVTLSYFPLDWPYEDRAARLAGEYGFACACARCALEAPAGRPSDESVAAGGGGGGGGSVAGMSSARHTSGGGSALMSTEACGGGALPAVGPSQPPADPAYVGAFLSKFCCGACSGTLAPTTPGGDEGDHVCNACGVVRSHADFLRSLEEEDDDEDWGEEEEEGMDE
jgi:hypothetical protein